MKMTPATSSNIAAIGYVPETKCLYVEFKNSKTFVYGDVSPEEHASLMASESIGKHFNQFIKAIKVGREVITVGNDTTPMSDKEKIKVLRDVLSSLLEEDEYGLRHLVGLDLFEQAKKALEATKGGE